MFSQTRNTFRCTISGLAGLPRMPSAVLLLVLLYEFSLVLSPVWRVQPDAADLIDGRKHPMFCTRTRFVSPLLDFFNIQ